jgi:hypothetical protein
VEFIGQTTWIGKDTWANYALVVRVRRRVRATDLLAGHPFGTVPDVQITSRQIEREDLSTRTPEREAQRRTSHIDQYWSASRQRLRDAELLVAARRAYAAHVAGVAVECRLKAAICAVHEQNYLWDVEPELVTAAGHNLLELAAWAYLDFAAHPRATVRQAWDRLQSWDVASRYEPRGEDPRVGDFVQAARLVVKAIAQTGAFV